MYEIFLKLLNVSVTASWLVLAVVILRFILKRAPKSLRCLMWGLVGLRLVFPFSIKSALSLIPSREILTQDTVQFSQAPTVHTGITVFDNAVNPTVSTHLAPSPGAAVTPLRIYTEIAAYIWLAGLTVMAAYFFISAALLQRRVRDAVRCEDGIFESSAVPSPFVFGFIRPKIYMPVGMDPKSRELVAAHERAHIKRRDYLIKPLAFLILSVYWFNPVMWLAYVLLCRDIELACDERVLAELGPESKKPYSEALLTAVTFHRSVAACPVAFGEGKLKSRIKNVLSWKKPVIWITLASLVVCAVLAVCFLTNPKDTMEDLAGRYVLTTTAGKNYGGDFSLTLSPDGKMSFIEGMADDIHATGTWELDDGRVILKEDAASGLGRIFVFDVKARSLVFVAARSDKFTYIDLLDGDIFAPDENGPKADSDEQQGGTDGTDPSGNGVVVDTAFVSYSPDDSLYLTIETGGLGRLWTRGSSEALWEAEGCEYGTAIWNFYAPLVLVCVGEFSSYVAVDSNGAVYAIPGGGFTPHGYGWYGADWLMLDADGKLAIYTLNDGEIYVSDGREFYDELFSKALHADGAASEGAAAAYGDAFDADPGAFLNALSGQGEETRSFATDLLVYGKSYGDTQEFRRTLAEYLSTDPAGQAAREIFEALDRIEGVSMDGGVQPVIRGTGVNVKRPELGEGSPKGQVSFTPLPDWVPANPLEEGSPLPVLTGEEFAGFEDLTIPTLSAWKVELPESEWETGDHRDWAESMARSLWGTYTVREEEGRYTTYKVDRVYFETYYVSPGVDTEWGEYHEEVYATGFGNFGYKALWEDEDKNPFKDAPATSIDEDLAAARRLADRLGFSDVVAGDPYLFEEPGYNWFFWYMPIDGMGVDNFRLSIYVTNGYAYLLFGSAPDATFVTEGAPRYFLTPEQALYCVNYARSSLRADWTDCALLESPNPVRAYLQWDYGLEEELWFEGTDRESWHYGFDDSFRQLYYCFDFESDPIKDGDVTYTNTVTLYVDPFSGKMPMAVHEECYDSPYTVIP